LIEEDKAHLQIYKAFLRKNRYAYQILKNEINSILESMTKSQGIFVPETAVLTVLRKLIKKSE
jgi:hypothetical protein